MIESTIALWIALVAAGPPSPGDAAAAAHQGGLPSDQRESLLRTLRRTSMPVPRARGPDPLQGHPAVALPEDDSARPVAEAVGADDRGTGAASAWDPGPPEPGDGAAADDATRRRATRHRGRLRRLEGARRRWRTRPPERDEEAYRRQLQELERMDLEERLLPPEIREDYDSPPPYEEHPMARPRESEPGERPADGRDEQRGDRDGAGAHDEPDAARSGEPEREASGRADAADTDDRSATAGDEDVPDPRAAAPGSRDDGARRRSRRARERSERLPTPVAESAPAAGPASPARERSERLPTPVAESAPAAGPASPGLPDDQRMQKLIERESRADARETARLSAQAEREAAHTERRRARSRKKVDTPPSPAPGQSPAPPAPPRPVTRAGDSIAVPVAAPGGSAGAGGDGSRAKSRRRRRPAAWASGAGPGALAMIDKPAPQAGPKGSPAAEPEGRGSKKRRRRDEYGRLGEEAPIQVSASDRARAKPAPAAAPVLAPLVQVLQGLADRPRIPPERDRALAYLGFLGVRSRLPMLTGLVDDRKVDDVQKLPLLEALVDSCRDSSRNAILHRIAADGKSPLLYRLWALEILARAGDRSQLPVLLSIVDARDTDPAERLRALSVMADLGDGSRAAEARKLARDTGSFLATCMQAQAVLARMTRGEGLEDLRRTMRAHRLSVEERLTIALNLCELGDASTEEFLLRVVEQESDTVFDQLRALHGLALLDRPVHLGLLADVAATRKRPRSTATRLLVMMGDRSRLPALLADARAGDTEAMRTLVLAQVMDRERRTAAQLFREPRYRQLVAP
jgi:hypothetical protein